MNTTGYVQHDEWYRLVAQHVTDVVLLLDMHDRYLWVSPSVYDVLGWTPEQVIGRNSEMFVSPETQRRLVDGRQGAGDGVLNIDEMQVRCANGSWRWMSNRSTVVVLPDLTKGRVVSLRDIDDTVRARLDAAASAAHFQLIAEHASDLVCLADPARRLIWMSPNVSHVLGWAPEEMLGHELSDFAHPDDGPRNRDRVSGLYDPKRTADQTSLFGRLRTKDGGYRWMSGIAKPLAGDDGQLIGVAAGLRDVTDLVELKAEAEGTAEILRAVMDSARDPIIRFGRDGRIEYVNREVVRLTDWPEDRWIGKAPSELGYVGDAPQVYEAQLARVVADGTPRLFEFDVDLGNGQVRWFEANMSPVFGTDELVHHVVSSNRDVTERHEAQAALVHRATRDELTGVANRTAIMEDLQRALAGSHRSGRRTAALMIDLDHFKYVNDSLGHAAGDELLVAAARRLESLVRAGDLVGRLGGDEFVVVMRDLTDPDDAAQLAQRIVEGFRAAFVAGGTEMFATASIGIATASDNDATGLLREADTALYVAKQQGRDRHASFTEHLRTAASTRLHLSGELRPAFERGEFEVWFQPEVDLSTGRTVALEALLRWQHRSGEVYSAERFIDLAEESGLLPELGEWVLYQACRAAAGWQRADRAPVAVHVNLSANQLADPRLLASLDDALDVSGLHPTLLCLEVTEASMLRDNPAGHEHLAAARARGVRISIDDFGTGGASLASLRDLPVDLIKVDGSFVSGIARTTRDRRILAGIVALAAQLEIAVTAEGIENEDQVIALRAMGCATGQGFHLAPPMPADDVLHHLQREWAARPIA